MTGTIFVVNAGTVGIQVPAADGKMRFWRGTTVATQAVGAVATLPNGTLGYEWDEDRDNGFRPAGLIRLSDTTASGVDYLQDYGSTYASGTANHALTLYRHASGARVFGAGTVQWSWGLDSNHDRGSAAASLPMKQATVNLMADMGVQPLTIQAGLVTTPASTDTLAPSSTITSPAAGGTVAANATVTITGTAVDNGGGQVGGVEVSVDGGTTWHRAIGRAAWSYSWQTGAGRTVTLRSRATDDSGNIEVPGAGPDGHRRHRHGELPLLDLAEHAVADASHRTGFQRGRARDEIPDRCQRLHHGDPLLQRTAECRSPHRTSVDRDRHEPRHGDVHAASRRPAGSRPRWARRWP